MKLTFRALTGLPAAWELIFSHLANDATIQEQFDFVGVDELDLGLDCRHLLVVANLDVDRGVGQRRFGAAVVQVKVENFATGDAVVELLADFERQDSDLDEVGAKRRVERRRQHSSDAEKVRTLRGPVPSSAAAEIISGNDDRANAFLVVPLRGVEDGRRDTGRVVDGVRPDLLGQRVLEPRVRKRAPDHDLPVASAGPVGVEEPGHQASLG